MSKKQTYTVIVKEEKSPFPPIYAEILIYVVKARPPVTNTDLYNLDSSWAKKITRKVAKCRMDEFNCDAGDKKILKKIAKGLRVKMVMRGDVDVVGDYRE